MNKQDVILVTAVGNIGPGSQIVECLNDSLDKPTIIGTDISGNNINCKDKLDKFYVVKRGSDPMYGQELQKIIEDNNVRLVFICSIGEAVWYYDNKDFFEKLNVKVVLDDKEIFKLCMNKDELFKYLSEHSISVPKYKCIKSIEECKEIDYFPVVIKQNSNAIASQNVYVAFDKDELLCLFQYMRRNNIDIIAQEWKGNSTQEYSVSVISDESGKICGSIAIKRDFTSSISRKATYYRNNQEYIISSGITQGDAIIGDESAKIRQQVSEIAKALNSKGPLNVQGVWDGKIFWPFDIHPAITGGAYMRALAGCNEPLFYSELLLHNNYIPLECKSIHISREMKMRVDMSEV